MWAYLEQINAFTTSSILSKLITPRKQNQRLLLKTQLLARIHAFASQSCLTLMLRFINLIFSYRLSIQGIYHEEISKTRITP